MALTAAPPVALVVLAAVAASNAWARASIGASTMGAAYLTLTDNGAPDSLTGVTTPVAASASLHQTTTEGGIKRMRPVPVLPLAPGKSVTFAPGGYHIMLMGLTHKLKAGEQFPRGKSLGQVIVGPDFQPHDPVGLLAARGEHQNGHPRRDANAAQDLQPVDAR